MHQFSRRSMLSAPLGLVSLSSLSPLLAQAAGDRPHFFLQILIRDGMDSLYMFDSRPRSFTAAGRVAHYAAAEAQLWEGARGGRCFASAQAAAALKSFKSQMAIINGVHMPPGFDGHDQNINALLSNNPFGGKYFGGILPPAPSPFERVEIGNFRGVSLASGEQTLNIDPETAAALNAQIKTMQNPATLKPWQQRLQKRAERCGQGSSLMAQGCAAYATGLSNAKPLFSILAAATPDYSDKPSNLEKSVHLALSYFKAGLTQAALLSSLDHTFDAHFVGDAQASDAIFKAYLKDLRGVLRLLQTTAYDEVAGLSMLDVTTVMISSEFGRTHGQAGRPVANTGTDHNTMANSVMLIGKGIRGDIVLGATDLDQLDAEGNFAAVSKLHQTFDEQLLKKIGRPFDFASQEVAASMPESYDSDDYITSASVVNTLLSSFGAKQELWLRNPGPRAKPAKILSRLLNVMS